MDGTLTVAVHDFDAIRDDLGLESGSPILEQLAGMSDAQASKKAERLQEIEIGLAGRAVAADGAVEMLDELKSRGHSLGILTRNSVINANRTLEVCELDHYFAPADVYGRDSCEPKPDPEGVLRLLAGWNTTATNGVMVGDYLFDIVSGQKAGVTTVFVDAPGDGEWSSQADVTVPDLNVLLDHIRNTSR